MKILLVGATSQVGHALIGLAAQKGVDLRAFSSDELDITRSSRVLWTLRRLRPDFVVNTAAFSAVDAAEKDPDACMAVNVEGVKNLARTCAKMSVPIIHLSSNQVFDGLKTGPYAEDDEPNPQSVYARSKLAGEQALIAAMSHHIILRSSWIFSQWRNNFVNTIIDLAVQGKEFKVVNDQIGSPTSASDLARVIFAIIEQLDCGSEAWGTYHYCGKGETSWYEFARRILTQASKYLECDPALVEAMPTSEAGFVGKRPLNGRLSCRKILDNFGIQQRDWQAELARVVETVSRTKKAGSEEHSDPAMI